MRILVVEGEPVMADFLAGTIRATGYEAQAALDGTEALNVLSATPVNGVFMDLVMPGLRSDPVGETAAKAAELGAVAVLENRPSWYS